MGVRVFIDWDANTPQSGFGRYPHRNELLGRTSTPEELEYLASAKAQWIKSVKGTRGAPAKPPPAQMKSARPKTKPMRILVLHGFRQNAHIMRRAIKPLVTRLRAGGHQFHFVESPQSYQVGFTPDGATDVVHDTWNSAGAHQKVWWNASDDGKVYAGAEKTMRFIEELWRKEGGFDGVLGFSQASAPMLHSYRFGS